MLRTHGHEGCVQEHAACGFLNASLAYSVQTGQSLTDTGDQIAFTDTH